MSDIPFSFKATGYLVSLLDKILKSNICVEGLENLTDKPTLFVVNHFTRIETFLLPYIILKHRKEMVHSLADASLFHGRLGTYLKSLGAISTKEPFRNRKIIQELMTGSHDWVIFPEGIMVKNKKIFESGRFMMDNPERKGPPHTGAAVLALKAEIYKRNYLNASRANDFDTMDIYKSRYGIMGASDICQKDIVIVPVNISYYPVRPEQNMFTNLASYFVKALPERVEEELLIEGRLLLSRTDIHVYFNQPISVGAMVDKLLPITQKVLPTMKEDVRSNFIVFWNKNKLTQTFLHDIYNKLAINIDHIFSSILRHRLDSEIDFGDLARILYLSAVAIYKLEGRRAHPSLGQEMIRVITDEKYEPFASILTLAQKENALHISGHSVHINKESINSIHPFHRVRLANLISVFANELEPIHHAVEEVKKYANMPKEMLLREINSLMMERERSYFDREMEQAADRAMAHPRSVGEPFYLKNKDAKVGVVLCHGYLAAPQEVRALAEHLYNQGYSVYGVRLKGHGTAPSQLASVTYQDWISSFNRAYAILKCDHDNIVLGGFSAGGLLALQAGACKQKRVRGIFCINAAIKLNDIKSHLVPTVTLWNDLLAKFNIQKGRYEYIENSSENPTVNYSRNYLNGVRELERLIHATKKSLPQINAPTMVIQADEDPVVNPKSASIICEQIKAAMVTKVILPFKRHIIINGEGKEDVFKLIAGFIRNLDYADNAPTPNLH